LLAGATKAEAAATRRARRKRERILANKLLRRGMAFATVLLCGGCCSMISSSVRVRHRLAHGLSHHLRDKNVQDTIPLYKDRSSTSMTWLFGLSTVWHKKQNKQ
jgi:hypothetical protein